MPTTEEVITKYTGDETSYVRATEKAAGATKKLASAIDATQRKISGRQGRANRVTRGRFAQGIGDSFKQSLQKVSGPDFSDFSALGKTILGGMAGITAAAGAAGITAMKRAADFDALVKSLEAVEGQGKRTKRILADLRESAKLPGIELQDSIQSYVNLRRSGLGEDFAKTLIREFGNANALSGGGQAEFSQVMRAITQIANKPFLQGDELVQLMEGGIPAYSLIKEIFGTSDTEELKRKGIDSRKVLEGLTEALSKMPRVATSAKNEFENLGAAINQAFVAAGSALNRIFLPKIQEVTAVLEDMTEGGVISRAFEDIATMLSGALGGASTEDLLYDMLAELKTVAMGVVLLAENTKGMVETIKDAWEWLTKPRGGPELEQWERNRAARGDRAPSLPELREMFLNEMETEKAARRQEREKAAKKPVPLAPKPIEDLKSSITAPIIQTAQNTSKMVALQQRQMDLTETVIGGSSRVAIDRVTLGNLTSGRRQKAEREMARAFNAFYFMGQEAAINQFIVARRGRSF
jgi:tape measure domain-containing protein